MIEMYTMEDFALMAGVKVESVDSEKEESDESNS
jgi:hypothetical protein